MLSRRLADGRRTESALLSMALDFVLAGRAATASALEGITPIDILMRGPMACDAPTDPALYRPMGIAA
ncbi:MAG: hypothetical protein KBF27_01230 [Cypionkella sp.]|nr:hypothetical protein [Cypionkella sp.]